MAGYVSKSRHKNVENLLFMVDVKLYGKDEFQVNPLVDILFILRSDIGMESWMKKNGVLVLKRGKLKCINRLTMPLGEVMEQMEEAGYKYLGILEKDKLKEKEVTEKF